MAALLNLHHTPHHTPHTTHSASPWQINDALGPAKPAVAASRRSTTDPSHRLCFPLASTPAAFSDALVHGPQPPCFPNAAQTHVSHCRLDYNDPARALLVNAFDPEKAARLGAFSFSVYGNPSGARYFRAKDGSNIGFSSDDVVRNNFQYLLFAHIKRAKDLPKETNLVDRVMQGSSDPDPVATIEVRVLCPAGGKQPFIPSSFPFLAAFCPSFCLSSRKRKEKMIH